MRLEQTPGPRKYSVLPQEIEEARRLALAEGKDPDKAVAELIAKFEEANARAAEERRDFRNSSPREGGPSHTIN